MGQVIQVGFRGRLQPTTVSRNFIISTTLQRSHRLAQFDFLNNPPTITGVSYSHTVYHAASDHSTGLSACQLNPRDDFEGEVLVTFHIEEIHKMFTLMMPLFIQVRDLGARCTLYRSPCQLQVWFLCFGYINFWDFRHLFLDGSDSKGLWPLLRLVVTEAFARFSKHYDRENVQIDRKADPTGEIVTALHVLLQFSFLDPEQQGKEKVDHIAEFRAEFGEESDHEKVVGLAACRPYHLYVMIRNIVSDGRGIATGRLVKLGGGLQVWLLYRTGHGSWGG